MNKKIARWFQEGKFYEALSGEGTYFVMDHTYRNSHDLILVLSTMVDWAQENNVINYCTDKFIAALIRIIKENPVRALSIINGYLIVEAESKSKLSIDFVFLCALLKRELGIGRSLTDNERNQLESLIKAVGKKAAVFKKLKD